MRTAAGKIEAQSQIKNKPMNISINILGYDPLELLAFSQTQPLDVRMQNWVKVPILFLLLFRHGMFL